MPGCKLCFFGRFYVSPQISRKNGENKLHLEVHLYCSGKRTSPQLRPSVFPKETSRNLFWKHQEVSKRTRITADGQEDSDKTKGDVKKTPQQDLTLLCLVFGLENHFRLYHQPCDCHGVREWFSSFCMSNEEKGKPGYWHMTFTGIN